MRHALLPALWAFATLCFVQSGWALRYDGEISRPGEFDFDIWPDGRRYDGVVRDGHVSIRADGADDRVEVVLSHVNGFILNGAGEADVALRFFLSSPNMRYEENQAHTLQFPVGRATGGGVGQFTSGVHAGRNFSLSDVTLRFQLGVLVTGSFHLFTPGHPQGMGHLSFFIPGITVTPIPPTPVPPTPGPPTEVPEPASVLRLGSAVAGMAARTRRRALSPSLR